MLINLSNHPFESWSETQKKASFIYGHCEDFPFPPIPADYTKEQVDILANEYFEKIRHINSEALTVHIMGEQTFCFSLINKLQSHSIKCIASCSERDVTILPDGSKQVRFNFTRFREY